MEMLTDLRQKHLAAWTRTLREMKPADVANIVNLPEVELNGVSVKAAIKAGWFVDVSDPAVVDDMRGGEVMKLSAAVWEAYNAARAIDPN